MTNLLTVVVPCFNEQETLLVFYDRLRVVADEIKKTHDTECEVLFVDDGSYDDSSIILKKIADMDNEVFFLSFSRNFGKEAAIYAGFEHARGNRIALLDADLQDPPELLAKMYNIVESEDYDCAAARRIDRVGEPIIRSFFAKCFYKIIRTLSGLEIVDGARDFRIMNRKMLDAILSLDEKNRFSKGIFPWVGFKTKWIPYKNVERMGGETKWSFIKLLFYAFDGVAAFTSAPLTVVSVTGIVFMLLSFITVVVIIVRKMMWGDPVAGWPSLACIIFFTSGVQCFFTGILGYYIAKIYAEIKRRPHYILKEENITIS